MTEDGTYSASDVLFDGEKVVFMVHWECCGVICGGGEIFSSGGSIGKGDGLSVWVKMWE